MTHSSATKIEEDLTSALGRVIREGERVILHIGGKGVAALVPLEDLSLLEAQEDVQDVEDAKRSLEEPGENTTLDELRSELGL